MFVKTSQYKARTRFGTADYEWYAKAVGIKLIWAKSAQCKGKIERFWGFVQDDFVPEVLKAKSIYSELGMSVNIENVNLSINQADKKISTINPNTVFMVS